MKLKYQIDISLPDDLKDKDGLLNAFKGIGIKPVVEERDFDVIVISKNK